MKVYQELARVFAAYLNCIKSGNEEWRAKHKATIQHICRNYLPHGSGFDNGVKFDFDLSTRDKLVLQTAFHHMNENGMYCGWTEHKITIRASLSFGFDLVIGGRDKNQIKEMMAEVFNNDLNEEIKLEPADPAVKPAIIVDLTPLQGNQ